MRFFTSFLLATFCIGSAFGEGSKNLTPTAGQWGYLQHDDGGNSNDFLKSTASVDERLYIHIKAGETLYYGLHRMNDNDANAHGDLTILIYRNNGTLASTATLTRNAGSPDQSLFNTPQTGVIDTQNQANAGPSAIVGGSGYSALTYTNTTGTDQNFYIAFDEGAAGAGGDIKSWYDIWDFSVYDGQEEKPGRMFCKAWSFTAVDGPNQLSSDFQLYALVPSLINGVSAGYYIKEIDLSGMAPWGMLVYANSIGADLGQVGDTNGDGDINFLDARMSQDNDIAELEYDLFINNPDIDLFPTSTLPGVTITDANFYCNAAGNGGEGTIYFESDQAGFITILIDLNGTTGFQFGTADVIVESEIATPGSQVIRWDGLNGLGTPVASGTTLTISGRFTSGPVHVPLWDVESNTSGITMLDVRPSTSFNLIYWDDSDRAIGSNPDTEFDGTNTSQHTWTTGDTELVNTWSYGYYQVNTQNIQFSYVCDPDGDGVDSSVDLDSDNDGIRDTDEGPGDFNLDSDADGIPNYLDSDLAGFEDSNYDGINDDYDADLDGVPDGLDLDSDNDGIPDVVEAGYADSDNNGERDGFTDANLDGWDDFFGSCATTSYASAQTNTGVINAANSTGSPDANYASFPYSYAVSVNAVDVDVLNSVNATGFPDGNFATFVNDEDYIDLYLGAVIPSGTVVSTRMQRVANAGNQNIDVTFSTDGTTFTNTTALTVTGTLADFQFALPINASYIRLRTTTDNDNVTLYHLFFPNGRATSVFANDADVLNPTNATGFEDANFATFTLDEDYIDLYLGGVMPTGTIALTRMQRIAGGGNQNVDVSFSTDGTTYTNITALTVTATLTDFTVTFPVDASYIRIRTTTDGDDVTLYHLLFSNSVLNLNLGGSVVSGEAISLNMSRENGTGNQNVVVSQSTDGVTYTNPQTVTITSNTTAANYTYTLTSNSNYIRVVSYNGVGVRFYHLSYCSAYNTQVFLDTDSDGIDNFLDLDSDNDGIVDTYEAGGTPATTGRIASFTDTNGNGLNDTQELVALSLPNSDGDGTLPDYLDLDSENDGILDNFEGQSSGSHISTTAGDTDGNGLLDVYDPDNGGTLITPVDKDSDGTRDYRDSDSDGDGVLDVIEGFDSNINGFADWDLDSDNTLEASDFAGFNSDTDGDGIWNVFDPTNGGNSASRQNTDGADLADWQDTDDDNDGSLTAGEDVNSNGNWADDFTQGQGGSPTVPDYLFRGDYDGDNIADKNDADSDNDGITDLVESNGEAIDPSGDSDNDGIANYRDSNVSGSLSSSADTNSDGVYDVFDIDLDGIPDFLDLDSDDDGIADAIEAYSGSIPNGLNQTTGQFQLNDPDNDGLMNYVDAQPASSGGLSTLANPDSDSDGIKDYLDIDSDGDGIRDIIESQTTSGYLTPTGTDTDGDGLDNRYDPGNGGTLIVPVNTDGLDLLDYLDSDSDNDNVPDNIEGHDANFNGVRDATSSGTDTDGDGLDNAYDTDNGGTSAPLQNTDGTDQKDWRDTNDDNDSALTINEDINGNGNYSDDQTNGQSGSIPDYLFNGDKDADGFADAVDLDSDNDGVPDTEEDNGESVDPSLDADNDGIPNYRDLNDAAVSTALSSTTDSNADGIYDVFDTDLDGIPDFHDRDSDNDGITDLIESGGVDSNGNGIVDVFVDTNLNGLADALESGLGGNPLTYPDSDGDGLRNAYDLDSDNDGIPDITEGGGTDTDGNGKVDVTTDANSDGLADHTPYTIPDSDNDRIDDYKDVDSDNDGITDTVENGGSDTNNDGRIDGHASDTDGDGLANIVDPDNGGTPINDIDTDGDGLADYRDLDSDNDGYPDNLEAGGSDSEGIVSAMQDTDADGIPDVADVSQVGGSDSDSDGIDNSADVDSTGGNDTDGDGIDNNLDPDIDGDGFDDTTESFPFALPDNDGDGNKNFRDLDSDNDGIVDVVEFGQTADANGFISSFTDTNDNGFNDAQESTPISPPDTDSDGVDNFVDIDSDNDGIVDNYEGQTKATYNALTSTDTDNDGLDDAYDPTNSGTLPSPPNTDGTGSADYLDADSDADTVNDNIEGDNADKNQYADWDSNTNNLITDETGYNLDADVDGLWDIFDNNPGSGTANVTGSTSAVQDSDNDGIWDFQDTDDDNDLATTSAEAKTPVLDPLGIIPDYLYGNPDEDGDGVNDDNDLDFDNDGLVNTSEDGGTGINPSLDSDNDGLRNFEDPDIDGDGTANTADTNTLTVNTTSFTDSNNDGVIDLFDTDYDGVPNFKDLDSDNDGIRDIIEFGLADANGDGTFDEGSGISDANGNGLHDPYDDACIGLQAGNATAVFSENSVTTSANTTGAPDNTRSQMNNVADFLVMDLGLLIPVGQTVTIDSRNVTSAHQMGVEQSADGTNFGTEVNYTFTTIGTDQNQVYTVTGSAARYFRITMSVDAGGGNIEVDALSYSFTICAVGTAITPPNTDSDSYANYLDLDSDQDGIPDNREAQTEGAYIAPVLADTDGDGIMNVYDSGTGTVLSPINTDLADNADYLDTDSDNDGVLDRIEGWDSDHDGYADWDTDNDNDPSDESGFSVDNDSDGILLLFDSYQGRSSVNNVNATSASLQDNDADAVRDFRDTDDDADGTLTSNEDVASNYLVFTQGGSGIPDYLFRPDADADGVVDAVDLDSDNDGVPNATEFAGTAPFGDADADGIYNYLDAQYAGFTDTNSDGVDDRVDKDRDGVPNFFDLDSDNDGIYDAIEANSGSAPSGFSTTTGRYPDVDADNDGLVTSVDNSGEAGTPLANPDSDSDGIADYLDLDSDNDGITDNREAQTSAGYVSIENADTDGDGLKDVYDANNGGTAITPVNSESNGNPDYLDTDSDNDNVLDQVEGYDANKNGYSDLDLDQDGSITDETGYSLDDDSDGLRNVFDNYSGYGIANITGVKSTLQDTDADGTPDFRDGEDDSDGINTTNEDTSDGLGGGADGLYYNDKVQGGGATPDYLYFNDIDDDGIADGTDLDSDNDGITDASETLGVTYTGASGPFADDDGDGLFNYLDSDATNYDDTNNDGIDDRVDSDLDGVPNFFDLDCDNDGIPDGREANAGTLPSGQNSNGQFPNSAADVDNDGLADNIDGGSTSTLPLSDSDGDGVRDYLDIDSDNDGIVDLVEAGGNDFDGDGMLDSFGDTDGDGLGNTVDSDNGGTAHTVPNTDSTGGPNYLDRDSEDDGLADHVEGFYESAPTNYITSYANRVTTYNATTATGSTYSTSDTSPANGIPDYLDDADSDGIPNLFDFGNPVFYDSDGDGLINLFDTDAGGDFYGNVVGVPDRDEDATPNVIDLTDTPLPLDFLSFEGMFDGSAVNLTWTTTNEVNVSHFEVEYSITGTEFTSLGEVVANNVRGQLNTYEFAHTNPTDGYNFYRIRELDFDGYTDFSRIIHVGVALESITWTIYPNPVVDKFVLHSSRVIPKADVRIISNEGKLIYSKHLSPNDSDVEIDLSSFKSGIYVLQLDLPEETQSFRIIKN